MPLYMDCHHVPGIKIKEAEKAHLKDLAVQEKYNVKYLAYWVNEESGRVFCLMHAPSKEAIQKTHLLANGVTACNIVEVEGGLYTGFIGNNLNHKDDLVLHENGDIDKGYRFLLNLDVVATTLLKDHIDFEELKLPQKPVAYAEKLILKNNGNILSQLSFDRIIAIFNTPESCLQCALQIREDFMEQQSRYQVAEWNFDFKIGLCIGEPVGLHDDYMFQKAIDESMWYSKIAGNNHIVIPEEFEQISVFCKKEMNHPGITVIHKSDQELIEHLFVSIHMRMSEIGFNIQQLSREMGVSKARLYRRLHSLANTSPVQFLRDIKLRKAISLIKEKKHSVTEIAYQLGYSNPSYFAKCFKKKYGISPSKILVEA